ERTPRARGEPGDGVAPGGDLPQPHRRHGRQQRLRRGSGAPVRHTPHRRLERDPRARLGARRSPPVARRSRAHPARTHLMTPVGRSGRWVASGYRGSVADSTAPVDRPGAPVAAVPEVGGYRLLTKIGEGGMGVVHLAQAPGGPRVALKVLRPHVVGDDEARARLAREVASLRLIHSPRVAEIVDADPWGALPFVATPYVPGLSLHEHLRTEGPIIGDELVWFARGLAEALRDVHAAGVLHRDIKPSNVLLEGRTPVLIDFGLARLAEDSRITHTGWLL